jgi:hypothetical protein
MKALLKSISIGTMRALEFARSHPQLEWANSYPPALAHWAREAKLCGWNENFEPPVVRRIVEWLCGKHGFQEEKAWGCSPQAALRILQGKPADSDEAASPLILEGDDWDELEPLVKRLIKYMVGRERADLNDLCPEVWFKDFAQVSEPSRETATSKANKFLKKRAHHRSLDKVRGEPILRWV